MSRNRLAEETSPYLRQHKDNPVHWYPWGEEAFAAAKDANKPILLSIGYAACHWCHVMAHESFEDPVVAAEMNSLFINIKVDREERPDVDNLYMSALSLLGEQGGWPLTMFLTPDAHPFVGGTYFPREPMHGRPGIIDVLRHVARIYTEQPDRVITNAQAITEGLSKLNAGGEAELGRLNGPVLDDAARQLVGHVDSIWGGLQGAPKFPMPFVFDFFWRAALRTGDETLREAVTLTLTRMAQGGIYDHLGGGFARYSTDETWLVPHFEKMLYDNAQLIALMTLVWKEIRDPLLAHRVAETIAWLEREMIGENGAFAATLDADSEGEEGKFYVWDYDEAAAVLGDGIGLFSAAYNLHPEGNWEGKTILHRNGPPVDGDPEEVDAALAPLREKLLAAREGRVRPGRDDKVLADWNGLMIDALARAGFAFQRPEWIALARRAFDAILTTMTHGDGLLGHALCQGRLQTAAMLEDYGSMINAALSLFEVTGDAALLDQARRWTTLTDDLYGDKTNGGYFQSAADATDMVVRTRPLTDNATPSGNGLMAVAHARLFLLTGDNTHRLAAERTIAAYGDRLFRQFPHTATALAAFDILDGATQVVMIGDDGSLARVVANHPSPNLVLIVLPAEGTAPAGSAAEGKTAIDGKPTAYVCQSYTCSPPVTDAVALEKALEGA